MFSDYCDSCNVVYINGVKCHEEGCPDAWLDSSKDCLDCGCTFLPYYKNQVICDGCSIKKDIAEYLKEIKEST